MRRPALVVALFLVVTATLAAAAAPDPTARIDAEDFGALPFMSNPKLSPDGARVASRAVVNGEPRLAVFGLGAAKAGSQSFSIPDKRDLLWYRWAGNDRLIISLGGSTHFEGEDIYATRMALIDIATGKTSAISKRNAGFDGDTVIYVDPDGRWLLMTMQESIYEYPAVWRVDLDTIKMKRVVQPHDNVWDWYADSKGTVRAGIGATRNRWWLLYRKGDAGKFEKIVRKRSAEENDGDIEKFIPIDGSDQGYAVANSRTGRYGLYHYDFANDALGAAIYEHPSVDIDDFHQTPRGEIDAVFYTDDRSRVAWLNPQMKEVQDLIDGALPGRMNRVISMNSDGEKMLVWTGTASDPGVYYYYEPAGGKMQKLAQPYDRLKGKALAAVEMATYRARDGLDVPAYLTLPRGREVKSLPLIVMPHGGPFVRDEWAYDTWAQFLANRGYLVLQPNFRGSTGYGKDFVAKGMGQWGRAMQDDLDDGVKWLVDAGKADPKRVCIMGASYGGYAAMWAAARNPDIYRCAISFAGISDVAGMLRYDKKSFSAPRYYRSWQEKVQGEDSFDVGTVSPLRAVDRIAIPLLIAHGSKDENVPPSQSIKLHEALLKARKPHEFVIYEGEEHGFNKPENAVDSLNRVDAFLRTHNPVEQELSSAR